MILPLENPPPPRPPASSKARPPRPKLTLCPPWPLQRPLWPIRNPFQARPATGLTIRSRFSAGLEHFRNRLRLWKQNYLWKRHCRKVLESHQWKINLLETSATWLLNSERSMGRPALRAALQSFQDSQPRGVGPLLMESIARLTAAMESGLQSLVNRPWQFPRWKIQFPADPTRWERLKWTTLCRCALWCLRKCRENWSRKR